MTEAEVLELGRTLRQALDTTTNLVPRVSELETWRDVLDAPQPVGGLPLRVITIENVVTQLRASWSTFRAIAAILSAAVALLTVIAYLRGPA